MIDAVITTLLAGAASHDLTDLETVRTELSIGMNSWNDNDWLAKAITQTSKGIMNATSRVFAPEHVQNQFYMKGSRSQFPAGPDMIQLKRFPVIAVTSVTQLQADLATTVTLVEDADFRVQRATGELLRINSSTGMDRAWETLSLTVKYSAGYGAPITESHVVPAVAPYQITANAATAYSCDQTVSYADGTALVPVASSPAQGQYSVNPATGVYTFAAADQSLTLAIAYCTVAIPDDLAEVCLRLVTGRFRARGRDPSMIQRETPGVGIERFWFGGAPGQSGQYAPDIQAVLDNYDTPTVA
jgi:hypothetical protein